MALDLLIQKINALTGFTNAAGVQVVYGRGVVAVVSVTLRAGDMPKLAE